LLGTEIIDPHKANRRPVTFQFLCNKNVILPVSGWAFAEIWTSRLLCGYHVR